MREYVAVNREAVVERCGERVVRRGAVIDPVAAQAVQIGLPPRADPARRAAAEHQRTTMKVDDGAVGPGRRLRGRDVDRGAAGDDRGDL